jgi:hypothetical protein
MKLGMSLAPKLELLLECTVCHQYMRSKKQKETVQKALLFGAAPYVVCVGCFQEVEPWTRDDPYYRARYRRRMVKLGLTFKGWDIECPHCPEARQRGATCKSDYHDGGRGMRYPKGKP